MERQFHFLSFTFFRYTQPSHPSNVRLRLGVENINPAGFSNRGFKLTKAEVGYLHRILFA